LFPLAVFKELDSLEVDFFELRFDVLDDFEEELVDI
jgi:hypothetical protein